LSTMFLKTTVSKNTMVLRNIVQIQYYKPWY
jgi:hypothetical protein